MVEVLLTTYALGSLFSLCYVGGAFLDAISHRERIGLGGVMRATVFIVLWPVVIPFLLGKNLG